MAARGGSAGEYSYENHCAARFLLRGGGCGGVGAAVLFYDDLVDMAQHASGAGRRNGRRRGGLGCIVVGAQRGGRYGRLVPGGVCNWVFVGFRHFLKRSSPQTL